jgi:hypothetical protein
MSEPRRTIPCSVRIAGTLQAQVTRVLTGRILRILEMIAIAIPAAVKGLGSQLATNFDAIKTKLTPAS